MATQFENTIKNYLDSRAKEDSLFAEAYKKSKQEHQGMLQVHLLDKLENWQKVPIQ